MLTDPLQREWPICSGVYLTDWKSGRQRLTKQVLKTCVFLVLEARLYHGQNASLYVRATKPMGHLQPSDHVCFSSLWPSDFPLVGSMFTKMDRVYLCPIDSIRRLFLPSAHITPLKRFFFSQSLAIGLPASWVNVPERDHAHPCRPSWFANFSYPLQRHYSIEAFLSLNLSKSDFHLVGSMFT